MEILERFRINVLFVVLVTFTVLFGLSGQVHAFQEDEFTFEFCNLNEAMVTGYNGSGGDVIIPDTLGGVPVTWVGSNAFASKQSIQTVILPQTVKIIDTKAFWACTGLVNIKIPESVTSIGEEAFYYCQSLRGVLLPESLTYLGPNSFIGSGLTEIKIPKNVTMIGVNPFRRCQSLTNITVDENNLNFSSIDGSLFDITGKRLISAPTGALIINIPQGTELIEAYAFDNSVASSITIPNGVNTIGAGAFIGCTRITEIDLPEGIKYIQSCAFTACTSLKYITIPKGVIEIGNEAFQQCYALETVTMLEGVTSIGNSAFYACTNLKSVILSEGLKYIYGNAFTSCYRLEKLNIPKSVEYFGLYVINDCYSLQSITFNSSTTQIALPEYYWRDTVPSSTIVYGYQGSTAENYANQFGKKFVPLSKKNIIIGKDNNRFLNNSSDIFDENEVQNYFISSDLFSKLTQGLSKNDKLQMIEQEYGEWGGECNGISFAMLLSKSGDIDINNFDSDASDFYHLDLLKDNEKLRQMFHYYHLSQFLPIGKETLAINPKYFLESGDSQFPFRLVDVLPTIVESAKSIESGGEPFEIGIYWENVNGSRGGHSVIANGYELLSSGEHKIQIVNPNITNGCNYLYISPDFTTFRMEDTLGMRGFTVDNSNWRKIGYLQSSALNSIDIDGITTMQDTQNTLSDDSSTFYINSSDNFSISNNNGETCNISEQGISGNLSPTSIDFKESDSSNNNSCTMVLEFPLNEYYSITPEQGAIDVSICDDSKFAAIKATGVTDIQFDSNNSVKINGSNCSYEAHVPSETGDEIVGISDYNGGNVSIEKQENGIKVHSDNLQSINVQTMTENGQTELTTSTEKNEILVSNKPNNPNGIVEIFVSTNNNGQFDEKIGETSVYTEQSTLESITISNPANKLNYTVGDSLDITGLTVIGTYSDGSTKTETITADNITGFNSSAPATDQVLTITVNGKTATFAIQITNQTDQILGDVDNNKKIEAYDALLALQIATGKRTGTPAEIKAADVDQSGTVQAYDALRILQYATGIITAF